MAFIDSQPADAAIHALAIRLARQCRFIIQACLREEEWGDADREFYRVIRQGLEDFKAGEEPRASEPVKPEPPARLVEAPKQRK